MKRRDFLLASCALTVASTSTNATATNATAAENTDKIRKAVKYHMVSGKLSVLEKFQLVQDLGFDGIETRVALGEKNKGLVDSYLDASQKTGLPIHGVIHSNNPTLKEAVDQASYLGANSVLHVVPYNQKVGYFENYRQTQTTIRTAVSRAEQKRVMILLENVWATFLIDPVAMAKYIDEIDSPMVGAYFDVGNVVRWGWPPHWIEVLGSRIKKLDIKEYDLKIAMSEGMRNGFRQPLGSGSIDWKQVRKALAKINYQGWATAEVKGGDRARLTDIASQINDVLQI
ncbi:MAG: sugar phosphate isomerase/epimerase family protein [Rubripirellula sp.]|jgi:hexulose-6-phosphate isomerase